jgi:hypothetical protein
LPLKATKIAEKPARPMATCARVNRAFATSMTDTPAD